MTHSHLRRISPAPMTDTDREAERDDLVRGRSAEQVAQMQATNPALLRAVA